jgi:hypothetical protein
MEVIGIIILLVIAFIVLGLMGWGLKVLGWVFDFLWEGCSNSIGCLFWVFIILFLIIGLIA